ncbi:hypothetical protein BpHYR1_013743 [Brachionus plicatilis]|uniref:Uncharacterized protein n=1 Tax=Brachionus plicatilis TaxID=10195 RepID=A0A3M7PB99_BRAPC|nr:hypothetical protein BpHYR1_013743 [Brachionus plicatilis]
MSIKSIKFLLANNIGKNATESDIPISNKRKRGAPIKTKSAFEFQSSELVSNKEIDIESLEDDDEEDDVVETTSKRAIMEKTNEIKSSSIQITCEKCNTKMLKKKSFLLSKWLYKKNR